MVLDDGTNAPSAARRGSRTGGAPAPEPEPSFAEQVAALNVPDVLARVRAGTWDAAAVLSAESAGRRRSGVMNPLGG